MHGQVRIRHRVAGSRLLVAKRNSPLSLSCFVPLICSSHVLFLSCFVPLIFVPLIDPRISLSLLFVSFLFLSFCVHAMRHHALNHPVPMMCLSPVEQNLNFRGARCALNCPCKADGLVRSAAAPLAPWFGPTTHSPRVWFGDFARPLERGRAPVQLR